MQRTITKLILLSIVGVSIMAFIPGGEHSQKPIYLNTAYSFEERAADLVSRMTPEEKQSQFGNTMPAIPRLGINSYNFWGEALHGIMGRNNNSGMTATSFPNSVAAGATWDPELIKRETEVISDEARGFNHDLIFTLTYWSPVIEPARDPRWGRTAETFGEDPYLVSEIGKGFIQGMMGDDPRYLKTVPCGKHYLANNTEFNRHSGSSELDQRDMYEYYLLPYRTLIRDYNLPSIMTSYNAVNGVPVSASKFLVDTIARKLYGLEGYVTSDCGAIDDIVRGHHYADNYTEAAAMGISAGVDIDCGGVYQNHALKALEAGLITQGDIDKALINIFTIRMRTGEFDPKGMVPYAGIKPHKVNDPSHNDLAIEMATKTPVLLKNNEVSGDKALPIDLTQINKIAVLGPQADLVELGDYSGPVEPHLRITPLAGIQNYIKVHNLDTEVVSTSDGNTSKNTDFYTISGFSTVTTDGKIKEYDATNFDQSAKGVIASERFGRSAVRGIKDGDWTLYDNIDITDVDSIRFNMTIAQEGGLLEVRVGSATGNVLASKEIVSGNQENNNSWFRRPETIPVKINTLGITGPQTLVLVYHEPEPDGTDQETLDMAASADVALVFVGTDQSTGREESDRFAITLPGNQNKLIKDVADANPNTIVVMQTMGMVEVEEFRNHPNIKGIIWTGYNGQAQGTAMAKILFGEVNPGGKLNVTWHKSLNDLPEFNDYTLRKGKGNDGRTYWYFDDKVSYEFGFGLSYTTFAYSNFAISRNSITPNDKITVSVDVKNTGKVDGDEIVQVYVKTPDSPASYNRPIKRLKGFQRVTIPKGQVKRVHIDIDCEDLWFWDAENDQITFDQGKYIFEIGASSRDIKGQVEATMQGSYKPELVNIVAESDRIVLEPGDVIQTSVTAAMTDDSFYNINKVRVTYRSNNPDVVSVDPKGEVTATGIGVASVFADVTIDGKTVSDSYPVKVMPDLTPGSILVNGKIIPEFNQDIKAYSYLLKKGSTVPKVKASAVSNQIRVDIQQAKDIPGTAVVTLVDDITLEKNIYYVNFDAKSVSDEFNGSEINSQWKWLRENPSAHSLTEKEGALTITSEPGGVSERTNNAKNILLQSANSDWTIETKLVGSRMPSQPENAGIIVYQDDENFIKLVHRAVIKTTRIREPQPGTIDLVIEENDISKSLASFKLKDPITGSNELILKLTKKGSMYTAYYSVDNGENFENLGTADLLLKDIRAGLMVADGIISNYMKSTFWFDSDTTKPDTPFDISFDYFRIESNGNK
ncbi:beta-glucosidase-like glycosyl hydrolase [Marinilabilia salmonicolor]|jgi:beta-glucosidase-like glycosyl hydrolase|uniref:glycoside hydrolase family 3 C-terminal domain-containing protein n=1 Tax=Marinilabilia salmonicolor TaxID=989 RepID=UPI000D075C8E|nr:glycoside hydrolase family 3 C-terminal domain-containing protein [Marinilabilia salmonicolor]PRY96668.1 beta-glucosidase-like glycosyl hydrolase [Marinilabilia salmonicolor]